MKKQKGMTLISLIVYIIALLIVMSVITVLTGYFYNNVDIQSSRTEDMEKFTQFTSYFVKEVNTKAIKVVDNATSEASNTSYIAFSNKNTYTFANNTIYFNEIAICNNIDKCLFSSVEENGIYKITVDFKTGDFSKTITYTTN